MTGGVRWLGVGEAGPALVKRPENSTLYCRAAGESRRRDVSLRNSERVDPVDPIVRTTQSPRGEPHLLLITRPPLPGFPSTCAVSSHVLWSVTPGTLPPFPISITTLSLRRIPVSRTLCCTPSIVYARAWSASLGQGPPDPWTL